MINLDELKNYFGDDCLISEPMSRHTSFKVGGPADALIVADTANKAINAISYAKKAGIPYIIIGNGSNLLVSDKGIEGIVIAIKSKEVGIEEIKEQKDCVLVKVNAAGSLAAFAKQMSAKGYIGLEFAGGIPGSIGGGVAMNAGAYDGEMSQVLYSADIITDDGVKEVSADELELTYRNSKVLKEKKVVISATFKLAYGDADESLAKIAELNKRRRDKQPLEFPSAGSTFKRPTGYFAGKLIQDSGLSGKQIGGAQVSPKHNGFVINAGNATADDILKLIDYCKKEVNEKFGVSLEEEVRIIGRV